MSSRASGDSWKPVHVVAIVGGIVGAIGGISIIIVLVCRYGVIEHM